MAPVIPLSMTTDLEKESNLDMAIFEVIKVVVNNEA
jgi:hypothetical protein